MDNGLDAYLDQTEQPRTEGDYWHDLFQQAMKHLALISDATRDIQRSTGDNAAIKYVTASETPVIMLVQDNEDYTDYLRVKHFRAMAEFYQANSSAVATTLSGYDYLIDIAAKMNMGHSIVENIMLVRDGAKPVVFISRDDIEQGGYDPSSLTAADMEQINDAAYVNLVSDVSEEVDAVAVIYKLPTLADEDVA